MGRAKLKRRREDQTRQVLLGLVWREKERVDEDTTVSSHSKVNVGND